MTTDVDPVASADRDGLVDDYFRELDEIADRLSAVPALYARRLVLFESLRALDPPVPFEDIARHTDGKPEAVRVALTKKRRAEDGNPITRKKTAGRKRR